jgi:hypothetical protein
MKRENVNRRDFTKLSIAAMGGMMAGSLVGCGDKKSPDGETADKSGSEPPAEGGGKGDDALAAWTDHHVCQGLNACEGKGKGGDNKCAGLGKCFTANEHTCHAENECKYQGGCHESVASNECKGKGECAVPLSESTWERAYKKFKADMEKAGKADKLPAPPGPPK